MYKLIRCLYAKRETRACGDFRGEDCLSVFFKHCNLIEGVKLDGTGGETKPCLNCNVIRLMDNVLEGTVTNTDISEWINYNECGLLISGGEPTYGPNLIQTLAIINILNKEKCKFVDVETNGYHMKRLVKEIKYDGPINIYLSPNFIDSDNLDYYIRIFNNIKTLPSNIKLHLNNYKHEIESDYDIQFSKLRKYLAENQFLQ